MDEVEAHLGLLDGCCRGAGGALAASKAASADVLASSRRTSQVPPGNRRRWATCHGLSHFRGPRVHTAAVHKRTAGSRHICVASMNRGRAEGGVGRARAAKFSRGHQRSLWEDALRGAECLARRCGRGGAGWARP